MEYSQRMLAPSKTLIETMDGVESQLKIYLEICGDKCKIVRDGSNIFAYWKGELVLHCSDFHFSSLSGSNNFTSGTSYNCHWNHYVGKKLYAWLTNSMIYDEKEEAKYQSNKGLLGKRIEISPHYDLWMKGCKYGDVKRIKDGRAHVRMDNDKSYWFPVEDLK